MSATRHLRRYWVSLLTSALCAGAVAQQTASQQPAAQAAPSGQTAAAADSGKSGKAASNADRRRAARLFLDASKLYEKQQFEAALEKYNEAAQLDTENQNYRLAAGVAQSHAITALMQTAAQQRSRGDIGKARETLTHALQIEPGNKDVLERLQDAGGLASAADLAGEHTLPSPRLGELEQLVPTAGVFSFHLRTNQRQLIQQVFKAWGIDATVDESVRGNTARLDLENATFGQAMRAVSILTNSFYVAVDAHRALVARDTRELRQQYTRNGMETLPLSGLTTNEMTDMANMARNVFQLTHTAVDQTAASITLSGSGKSLEAFNSMYQNLTEGRGEVMLEVKLLQVAHNNDRITGVEPSQQITIFNVLAEARSIIQQNQALVQQIISSGLAGPTDYAKILAILIASGQVSNTVFSNGWVEFGGSCNLSQSSGGSCSPWAFGASPQPVTFSLNLNSSDSRELDDMRLRLVDNEEGTLKSGTRYPIQTSSYSSLSATTVNIPGLTTAGNSGALAGLLSNTQATTAIPQVQYEDLGLTLKARPRVLRSGDVALTVDMKITSLAGGLINGVPVLANRAYSGAITLPAGRSVVIAGEMDSNETRAISGTPGLSEVPGLDNITQKEKQLNRSTLVIILTPHVVRNPHGLGHSPMFPVDASRGAQ